MKFNKYRQFAQVALFSLMALSVSSAFAQGIPNIPATDSSKATGKAIDGQGESGDQKMLVQKPCQCKVVHSPAMDFFLSQDMPTGTSAGTDLQCRAACTTIVTNPGATQLGTTVTNYLQNKCHLQLKVYGKKTGNNYGGQNPDIVNKVGTGIFTASVPAHCPAGYSYPGPAGPTCVIDIATVAVCGTGFWVENTYAGQPHPVCVKQAAPQGSMPGVPAWQVISGNPSSGGAYLTDANGGTRFFIDPQLTCPSGNTLTLAGYKPGFVCRKSIAAIPFKPNTCTG